MELIQTYVEESRSGSDSDSTSEAELEGNKSNTSTVSFDHDKNGSSEPYNPINNPAHRTKSVTGASETVSEVDPDLKSRSRFACAVREGKERLNSDGGEYFGLLSSQLGLAKQNIESNSIKSFVIDNDCVEVPDGDFWSDFTPDPDSKQDQMPRTSHDEYYQKQITTGDEMTPYFDPEYNKIDDSHPHSPCYKSRHLEARSSSHPYSSYHKPNRLNKDGHSSTNTQSSLMKTSEKRKLFYIHSKVAPYLNADHGCKPASRVSSSWLAHEGAVNMLSWNQSNFSHLLVTAGMDSQICVWNVWSSIDQCVSTLSCHQKAVKHVEWCQAGRSVFSCSYDRTAQVSDAESGQSKAQLDHIGFVTAGSVHPSNPHHVITGIENMVFMWDVRTPQAPVKHFAHKEAFGQVQGLLFIADGRELVSCADQVSRDSADRTIMVWDVRSTAVLSNQIFQERYTCTRLKLHRDKSHFLAQTHGGYVALFSTSSPYKMEKSKRFGGHKLLGYSIGFDTTPDGTLVYSGSAEGGAHCYDYRTGRLLCKLTSGSDHVIMDVACHPVLPSVLATCTWGGSIRLWQ